MTQEERHEGILELACDKNGLADERLNKAFDVWYPTLEAELKKLREVEPVDPEGDGRDEIQTPKAQEILEEILELSRINQKLIRSPDGALASNLDEIGSLLLGLRERMERLDDPMTARRTRRLHPMILEDFMEMSRSEHKGYVGVQMAFGLLKNQYPWIYDIGTETINILRSNRPMEQKHRALDQFRRFMRLSVEHPIMREMFAGREDVDHLSQRLQEMLFEAFERHR